MRSSVAILIVALVVLSMAAGCAPRANQCKGISEPAKPAGFLLGVWHGFIALFVFVGSLFRSDLNIYEVHNNGTWYNLGYLFGLMCFFGGGGGGAARRR